MGKDSKSQFTQMNIYNICMTLMILGVMTLVGHCWYMGDIKTMCRECMKAERTDCAQICNN